MEGYFSTGQMACADLIGESIVNGRKRLLAGGLKLLSDKSNCLLRRLFGAKRDH